MKMYEDDALNFSFIIIYFQSIETLSNVFAWLVNKAPASFKTRVLKFYSNIANEEFRNQATVDFINDVSPYSIALSTSALASLIKV